MEIFSAAYSPLHNLEGGSSEDGAAMYHHQHEASLSDVIASIKQHSEAAISLENGLQIPAMLKQAVDQKQK